MKLDSLKKLYVHSLKDLYSAEKQIIEALPKMAEKAKDDELRRAFRSHLEETREHKRRLERIFQGLDFAPGGEKCVGVAGLIEEAEELFELDIEPAVLDAALVAAAQRVEHYEMAGYGSARAYAEKLGEKEAADVLTETLDEEAAADEKLTRLAERRLNFEAKVA